MTNEELDQARSTEALRLACEEGVAGSVSIIAARLAREGWTPPVAVYPDLIEAKEFATRGRRTAEPATFDRLVQDFFLAIKRGRELERAEAKPGLVWVKHDGLVGCPAPSKAWVTTRNRNERWISYSTQIASDCDWSAVTHYVVITLPTEDVA